MNPDQLALDPTLTQLFNELIRAHGKIQQLQARIVELEAKTAEKNGLPKALKDAVTQQSP